jgi:N-acetylglutamate synthase
MSVTTRIPRIVVRPMVIADYNQASVLWSGTQEISNYCYADSRKSIERFLQMNPDTCFVAELGEQIVGTILGGFDGRRGYIYHLVVEAAQRGRNLGGVLLEKTLIAMKVKDVDKVHIFVPNFKNRAAIAFWESHGFVGRPDLQMMSCSLGGRSRLRVSIKPPKAA